MREAKVLEKEERAPNLIKNDLASGWYFHLQENLATVWIWCIMNAFYWKPF